eukprot:SAG11_NODE_9129_length_940_cov_0.884661_1_plen_170_part_10
MMNNEAMAARPSIDVIDGRYKVTSDSREDLFGGHLVDNSGMQTSGVWMMSGVSLISQDPVLIKVIHRDDLDDLGPFRLEQSLRLERELRITMKLKHAHIVNLLDVVFEEQLLFLVFEQANGSLLDHLGECGRLTENEARNIFKQICSAVHYLHEQGVVHRELTLDNIVMI